MCGLLLKYQQDYENPHLQGASNIIAVLSSAILSPNFYTIPNTISLERVLYFYRFIVEYIIWNEYEVEKTFKSQKQSFEHMPPSKIKKFEVRRRV